MFHFKLTRLIFSVLWLTASSQSRSLPLCLSSQGCSRRSTEPTSRCQHEGTCLGWGACSLSSEVGWGKKTMFFPTHAEMFITQMGGPMHEQPRLRKTNAWRCLRWAKSLYGKKKFPDENLSAKFLSDVGPQWQESEGAWWWFSWDYPGSKSWPRQRDGQSQKIKTEKATNKYLGYKETAIFLQNWFDEVEDFKRENINPFKWVAVEWLIF